MYADRAPPQPSDLWTIATREELARFVGGTPESETLEYKGLRDLIGCGNCGYCSQNPGNAAQVTGSEVAKAVSSLALRHGGHIVIGAKIVDRTEGRHELETAYCHTARYTSEEVENRVARLTSPQVRPEVRAITQAGAPPAFIVRVTESLRLQGWRENPSGYLHFSRREGASTAVLEVDEIESVVRHLDRITGNASIRGEILAQILGLYYHVFERPGETGPWDRLTLQSAVAWDPCGTSRLTPSARGQDSFSEIETKILQIPSKIVTLHAPGDVGRAVLNLYDIGQLVANVGLSIEESRLLVAAHRHSLQKELYSWLSPITVIDAFAGPHANRVRQEFYGAPYSQSYSDVFDRVAPSIENANFDERLKRQAIRGMVEVLSDLLPLSYRVLVLYADLERRYGPGAVPF
jgi:hypothetical protein